LYRRLSAFQDPFEFIEGDETFATLERGYRSDMALAEQVRPQIETAAHLAVLLPDAPWARRVSGAWANALANRVPERAHAVLVRHGDALTVSIRAPSARPAGGGRPGAAGINALPESELLGFLKAFQASFAHTAR
jgi:hypothetical protein